MPTYESSKTFESSEKFEKYGQPIGTIIAGIFISVGMINAVDEVRDYAEAKNSSVCQNSNTAECEELLSTERKDSLASGLGGLATVTGLSYLVVMVSRRQETSG